jgi:hypothetical protein
LGTIYEVEDNLVQIIPYEQFFSDLSLLWIEMPSLIYQISKDRIIQKNISFTQKIVLR